MAGGLRTVVAGIGSLGSDSILDLALRLALDTGATLHVVHAYSLPHPVRQSYTRRLGIHPTALDRAGSQLQAEMEARVATQAPPGTIVCHAVEGPAGRAIAGIASELRADLVLVGAHRRGSGWSSFLGSTAEQVIRRSSAPVLVLRQPLDCRRGRTLLTTDLSAAGSDRCDVAVHLAHDLFAEEALDLRTLLVVEYDPAGWLTLNPDVLRSVAEEELDAFAQELGAERAGELRVRLGRPAEEILCEARDWGADLLVVGAHGGPGAFRPLLGSVAHAAVRDAPCNVLVIPRGSAVSDSEADPVEVADEIVARG
jgi:nucleotide-binding universal stress UspA family protein